MLGIVLGVDVLDVGVVGGAELAERERRLDARLALQNEGLGSVRELRRIARRVAPNCAVTCSR